MRDRKGTDVAGTEREQERGGHEVRERRQEPDHAGPFKEK